MGLERRRDRRHPFRLGVTISWGGKEIVAESNDVSFRGVFVATDAPLPERELVRLRVALPPDGAELAGLGMVARRLASGPDRAPGVGIQLYALAAGERERWVRFVRWVIAREGAPPREAPAAMDEAPESVAVSQPVNR
jgi:hypothetical protein